MIWSVRKKQEPRVNETIKIKVTIDVKKRKFWFGESQHPDEVEREDGTDDVDRVK